MNEPDFNRLDLIESYVENRLTQEEKSAFEKELQADPLLRQQLEWYMQVVEGIRHAISREQLKNQFRELEQKLSEKDAEKKNGPEKRD